MTNRKERRAAKSQGNTQSPEVSKLLEQAMRAHQAGRVVEAEPLYREVLKIEPRHPDALHLMGLLAHQVGRSKIAVELIGQAIKINNKVSAFHNNLGIALASLGNTADAVASYKRALILTPADAEVCNNLGVAYESQGKFDEALTTYKKALAISPNYASAYYNMGNVWQKQSSLDEAADCYQKAIAIKTNYFEAFNNLAIVLKDQGKFAEAAASCERSLAIKPDYAEAYMTLGSIYRDLNKADEALIHYQRALSIKPEYADAYNNLGLSLHDLGKFDEAFAAYERSLSLKPGRAEVYNNMGTAKEEQGELAEAQAIYEYALTLDSSYAETYYNLGNLAQKQGRLADAVLHYERAIVIKPTYGEAHWNHAFIRLLKGDLVAGWRESEWRWRRKNVRPHGFTAPLWDGGDLHGKSILLHCEQGLGDSIQFIRYARLVKEKGGQVLLACPETLATIFKDVDGIDQIYTVFAAIPAHACQAPLLSLPGLLGTVIDTIPAPVPYLKPDPARMQFWQNRLANYRGFKIGIVWRGNPLHKNDRNRSMKPAQFVDFLNLPNLIVINLQKDALEEEIQALNVTGSFLNAAPDLKDFADTAALLANLDLIITVDTSVCHLAGALGLPVWTLLPFSPDWRWLLERPNSPWYPTMRLFRQLESNNWVPVIQAIRNELILKTKNLC